MKLFVSCLFPLLAASLVAHAQTPTQRTPRAEAKKAQSSAGAGATAPASGAAFRRLDGNADGFLSDSELRGREAARFNWMAIDREATGAFRRTSSPPPSRRGFRTLSRRC